MSTPSAASSFSRQGTPLAQETTVVPPAMPAVQMMTPSREVRGQMPSVRVS